MAEDRSFRPPTDGTLASHTGEMWRNPDGTIGAVITDVYLWPIHIIGRKEGDVYHLRGWRGKPPEYLKIPLVDDANVSERGTERRPDKSA